MKLIEEFRSLLVRLNGGGWSSLFETLGIDPEAENLRELLLRQLGNLDEIRIIEGFQDLSPAASRPIEPRRPAQSILFHALASPAVTTQPDGQLLTAFPSAADLELAENLVFGIQAPSFADIMARLPEGPLALGVFAREYRQRAGTVHGAHADMVFSRTGIARVGTQEPHWDGPKRAFSPRKPGDDVFAFCTLPCRYGVYLAIQMKGNPENFGPFKANRSFTAASVFNTAPQSEKRDEEQDFWVPLHKLFSGTECLRDLDLEVILSQTHVNEKLRRIHLQNMGEPASFESGFKEPTIGEAPFTTKDGLAEFLDPEAFGPGVLNAVPRRRLIEPATFKSEAIGTRVPASNTLGGSFTIPALDRPGGINRTGAHRAPEWMHVRTQLKSDQTEHDLNVHENVESIVESGSVDGVSPYVARHYLDFTGDGWIEAGVTGMPGQLIRRVPAYSIISAPDFYPFVSQSEVLDWSMKEIPAEIRKRLWGRIPLSLCDQRVAPNLALKRHSAPFVTEDVTVSALVGLQGSAASAQEASSTSRADRATFLPDAAAGFYAPGWDTSVDFDDTEGVWHLAAHGLGSPFPEDAKLCAAISAFWPAVAPDTSRSWGRRVWRVIAPMIDSEIGLGDAPPWDGIVGPREIEISGAPHIEDDNFDHVDYLKTALNGEFTMAETMKVDQQTYQARIIASHRMFLMLAREFASDDFRMLSFVPALSTDADLIAAQTAVTSLVAPVHKFVMVQTDLQLPLKQDVTNLGRWLVQNRISTTITIFVGSEGGIVFKQDNGSWRSHQVV